VDNDCGMPMNLLGRSILMMGECTYVVPQRLVLIPGGGGQFKERIRNSKCSRI
jgi:hypothetical protein